MGKKIMMAAALALAAMLVAGAGPVAQAAEVIELTYSNFFPPTHVQSQLAEAWCKEVEKRTNGKVKVQYFPGQTLTKARQAYDGAVQGLSDVAMGVFGYTRGRFPLMESVDLPLGYPDGIAATQVINGIYKKFKPKELNNVEVMYLHAHGPGLLFTKDHPVKTLEDMKGLKIRSTGYSAKVVKALKGTPVAMPMPESYQSLQRGVVDGSMYPMESNKGWKLAQVVKYNTQDYAIAYSTGFFVVMNKAKWKSLPADAKKAIRQINQEWIAKHGKAWDASDQAGREYFIQQGGKFIPLSDKESARWVAAVKPLLAEYAKAAKAKGVPGGQAVSYAQEMLKNYKKK